MESEQQPILRFNHVSKTFAAKDKSAAGHTVLSDLSITLYPGMVVGLLGQNGAGKSTLMRCALGIIDIDQGDILTLGETPAALSIQAKERIGYVPQQPFGYEGFTIDKALELHRSFYPSWDMTLEQDWLERFDLDVTQAVQKLSVGQRQSLALIMAMAYRPSLLLLDEPVASLDPIARRKFMSDLFDLALDSGSAVLFSSHITSDLERVASHVALIKKGQLVLFKEIDALREEVKLLSINDGTTLPSSYKILSQSGLNMLVDTQGDSAVITGVQSAKAVNLEQLFMELHR
ncbi:ABC transporter ATP-binding protein [Shewanella sp. SR43-8]|jgi:ABC-2 type transport system ATP-binding protein|uniref:ABC transporter ATP-binding protein n=1 Tax=Shewanella sp. SR43-8 TaxID=2760938 RepID=UPI001603ACD8|nr:ABC transporter ATP-binding protein [Shewanella sp. SR43-8]MBB1322477.1 ABC transporter ATP-binding protein [Shewanella sp. SR43-8]|tara:strand:- start:216 stop:1085 length:870 start_codon:yes stop_codon:yes gene_type:complete